MKLCKFSSAKWITLSATLTLLSLVIVNLPATFSVYEVGIDNIERIINTSKLNTTTNHTELADKSSDKDSVKLLNTLSGKGSKGSHANRNAHFRRSDIHKLQWDISTKPERQTDGVLEEETHDEKDVLSSGKWRQLHEHFRNFLNTEPPNYLSNFKSPCWAEVGPDARVHLRCLPYFYLAGFPKCGTTDLFFEIQKHPNIFKSIQKEPHWWTRRRFQNTSPQISQVDPLPKKFVANFTSYLMQFDDASEELQKSVDVDGFHSGLTCEGSASTFWDIRFTQYPENLNLTEPKVVLANEIYHMTPEAKVIVILRNPTARLYSDYLFFSKKMSSPDLFHDLVVQDLDFMNDCFRKFPERTCAYLCRGNLKTRLHIGLYAVFMEEWLKVFPREQLHILRLEDYTEDKKQALTDIFEFLGLDSVDRDQVKVSSKQRNPRKPKDVKKGPMLPETKQLLDDFYRPFNTRLAHLLNNERYLWL